MKKGVVTIAPEIKKVLAGKRSVVGLESAFISHGLPYPINLETALAMEEIIREEGAVPATIGVVEGTAKVGLSRKEIEILAKGQDVHKVNIKDLAIALAQRQTGGTTVSATVYLAYQAGVRILATGGIGGIHRGRAGDISPDLPQLAHTPVLLVCSGAKAILDLPATREWLETHGIPVIGYKADEFPGFYFRTAGLGVDIRVESPQQSMDIAKRHWGLGLHSGILVTVPVPKRDEVAQELVEDAVGKAMMAASQAGVGGAAVTPFLLANTGELTQGATTRANISLLKNNARVAAQIARIWVEAS